MSKIRIKLVIATIAAFILILLMLSQVTSLLWTSNTISSFGSVKSIGVGVYWDSESTNHVSYVDWGLVEPGSDSNVTVYVRNEGNTAVTLSLNTKNWNPSVAPNYLALSWDYDGRVIEIDAIRRITLVLSISLDITRISSFSFDILIVGLG